MTQVTVTVDGRTLHVDLTDLPVEQGQGNFCYPFTFIRKVKPGHREVTRGWVSEREIPLESRPWRPFLQTVPIQDGKPVELRGETFWTNGHYLVFKRVMAPQEDGSPSGIHLSFRTVENDVRRDWREFQRLKNELAGPHWEAVELYPDVDRVVDTANQFHLFCFPFRLPFGFDRPLVADTGESHEMHGATQRPLTAHDHQPAGDLEAQLMAYS